LDVKDVKNGDSVHKACCSWHAGQDILYEKHKQALVSVGSEPSLKENSNHKVNMHNKSGSSYASKSYMDLIELHCQRIINNN
jgi:hypothetical protein